MPHPFQPSPRRGSAFWHAFWQKRHAGQNEGEAGSVQQSLPASFEQFLEAVRLHMQPEGRAQHMAGMHQYLLTLLPPDVTLADLSTGWLLLAERRNDTDSAV